MALFDLRPKASRRELFDREGELGELERVVGGGAPLTLVLGIRRIGKTSLVKAFLEGRVGVYVDLRGVVRRAELYERLSEGLSEGVSRVRRFIEGIRGVTVAGFGVELRWRGSDSVSLLGLLSEVGRRAERFILVLDELQSVKPPLSAELRNVLAYAYDNLGSVSIIVAGSEVGMLRNFLGVENPESPLYGRYAYEVTVSRFPEDLSKEFLRQGFREEGIEPPAEVIEEAVNVFDGIVGWLVYFGRAYADGVRDLRRIKEAAVRLAAEELRKLSVREKLVLKAMAEGARTWAQVRNYVEERTGVTIPKATLTRIIRKLENLSIVRNYEFLDPIYREASKALKIKTFKP